MPASSGKRTDQINVRLTADEKFRLKAAAKSMGFKGLGDFMRNAALEYARS